MSISAGTYQSRDWRADIAGLRKKKPSSMHDLAGRPERRLAQQIVLRSYNRAHWQLEVPPPTSDRDEPAAHLYVPALLGQPVLDPTRAPQRSPRA